MASVEWNRGLVSGSPGGERVEFVIRADVSGIGMLVQEELSP